MRSDTPEKICLILIVVLCCCNPFSSLPRHNASIVARCYMVCAFSERFIKKKTKFYKTIAVDIRIRRYALLITSYKWPRDRIPILTRKIPCKKRYVKRRRNAKCILTVFLPVTDNSPRLPGLHEHTNNGISLIFEERGRNRGVYAARHGDKDCLSGCCVISSGIH